MKQTQFIVLCIMSAIFSSQAVAEETQGHRWDLAVQGNTGLFFNSDSNDQAANYEFRAGFLLTEHLQLNLNFGNRKFTKKTSGGDLSAWQYVETTSTIEGDYVGADLKFWFNNAIEEAHGVFIDTGFERMTATASYEYNRYKPFNGAFCPFGCPDKALEESASSNAKITVDVAHVGTGYQWQFGKRMTLVTGLNYLLVVNPQNPVVGTTRQSSVGTALFTPVVGYFGLGLRF